MGERTAQRLDIGDLVSENVSFIPLFSSLIGGTSTIASF